MDTATVKPVSKVKPDDVSVLLLQVTPLHLQQSFPLQEESLFQGIDEISLDISSALFSFPLQLESSFYTQNKKYTRNEN